MTWRAVSFTLTLVTSVLLMNSLSAQDKTREFNAHSVRVLKKSATMYYQKDYWITVASGPVGSEGIPEIVRVGDTITVKNQTLVANYIFVTQCLQRMEWAGEILCERDQISCVVVEHPEDVPNDESRNRIWINVKHCEPID